MRYYVDVLENEVIYKESLLHNSPLKKTAGNETTGPPTKIINYNRM